ncbi:hypothetical protein PIROE2DRAFT_64027 [Piromyces sp. E2]|nr:hypothetical protein PIROE2DRAFT_64027 [Piromyces sp. E2]|eukprot:OUM59033.1 hypothetical protein PIROE2DRAFT_64027 [Piromyces sp. E2]
MCEVTYVEREIQTELSPLEQLDKNIGKINMEYDMAMKRQQEINKLTFEDRIIQYQKECEKRIRKEIEDEYERYKDIELGKFKLEEKRKQDLLISEHKKKLSDLEYEYTQKLREREIEERKAFLLKEQEFKHQLTKQQQKFNDEIERFLSKEDTLKREIEMNRRSQKLQEELIQKRLNDALKEIDRLKAQDIDSNKIIDEAKLRYKQEYEQKLNNKIKELDMEKKQLIYNQQELNSKLKKVGMIESKNKEIKNEYDKLKNKYQNLMVECNYIKNTSNKMAIENRNLQIQLQSTNNTKTFEDEIKSLKNKLIESQNQNEKRQLEYQEIIKTMINQSQKDINKNKKQIQWKQECEELIQKLNNEITHSEELKKICDEKTLRIKELERENADLSLLLHQTQSDPWMNQTPSNNSNVLLNSSVLPPPFSYIDIEKKMKREMIMRQVQEKEELNAKNGNTNNLNSPLNFNNNINIGTDLNDYNNNLNSDNFMMNPILNTYNRSAMNSTKLNINQQSNFSQPLQNTLNVKPMKEENINKNGDINDPLTLEINQNSNNLNKLSNSLNNSEKNDDILKANCSLKSHDSLSVSQKSEKISGSNNQNNIDKDDILSNLSAKSNYISKKSSISGSISINENNISVNSIHDNNYLTVNNNNINNTALNNKIDVISVLSSHSKQSEEIGKSISVCTLDIDSTELEIDLNQNSMKIEDSKIENTTHDPFEAQYKMLAQGGEDHIKELENRVLQGFESDDEIISIMSGSRKSSSHKSDSVKQMSENNDEDEEEGKDEETEKERPRNKWLKSKPSLNNDNSNEINKNQNYMDNNKITNDDFSSLLNLDKDINIDSLKNFGEKDNSDMEKDNENSLNKLNISNNLNDSNKAPFKTEDMVFNWEDEYDKSKIENAFKEINEKSNLDFSKLSLKTTSTNLSKKSLMTDSSIKSYSYNFGEGNTEDDEFR